ncbi:MAG: CPXCG motif-containing cysteine-rich protein, partial [Polyangiaceae bacterium]
MRRAAARRAQADDPHEAGRKNAPDRCSTVHGPSSAPSDEGCAGLIHPKVLPVCNRERAERRSSVTVRKRKRRRRARSSLVLQCPFCGEEDELHVDAGGGEHQTYTEDCAVCCRP